MTLKTKPDALLPAVLSPVVPRETRHEGVDGIAVVMPVAKAGGVRAYGDLKPGVVYVVAPAEALRLVTAKRFDYATAEDLQRGIAFAAAAATPEE